MPRLITRNERIYPCWKSFGCNSSSYPYIWLRVVFYDESEGFPGKEHIEVHEIDASHETLLSIADDRSDLEKYLEGWIELDPIEYKDGKTIDVPTYYLKVDDKKYFLAFVLYYDPTPKYYHPHMQINAINKEIKAIWDSNEDKKEV